MRLLKRIQRSTCSDGKKFQLASVKDVNYRTEETPGENNVENNHVYTYDKNGNFVYVNTGRLMNDGYNETGVGERKLIWDEENRLLAVDDNGFVSNYWYDADGERTVKTSGESDQVYINATVSPLSPAVRRSSPSNTAGPTARYPPVRVRRHPVSCEDEGHREQRDAPVRQLAHQADGGYRGGRQDGEVTSTRYTLIVPYQVIVTYVIQWTYNIYNYFEQKV